MQAYDAQLRSPTSISSLRAQCPPGTIKLYFWPFNQENKPLIKRSVRTGKLIPKGSWKRVGHSSESIEGILLFPDGHESLAVLTVTSNAFTEQQRNGKPRLSLVY